MKSFSKEKTFNIIDALRPIQQLNILSYGTNVVK